jgi:erythronate-4-phosphate dehydrogenase
VKIVADEQIPYLDNFFGDRGQLIKKSSETISPQDLKEADLLLMRSVNKINRELLENSRVKMVCTATAGFDHVDVEWLNFANIKFAYAPGCNANAVAEYVVCCIAKLIQKNLLQIGQRAGLIGVGHVGSRVLEKLSILNFSILLNDPPRELKDPNFAGSPLLEFSHLDLICVHTSLTRTGAFPSYHLLDHNFLQGLNNKAVIINASRGEVLDEAALLDKTNLCSDVWAHEPNINDDVAQQCLIATPHIAGYSLQAKYRATQQIYQSAKEFFSWPESHFSPHFERQFIQGTTWQEVVLQVLDPDPLRIQKGKFSENRKNYRFRNEFAFCEVDTKNLSISDQKILEKLGFNLQ